MACIAKRRGRWIVDFYDQYGRRRIESYHTQASAKDALTKRLHEVRYGTYRASSEIPTLEEVAKGWLVSKQDRRPSTVAGWENYVHAHIIPSLGALRLDRVQVREVEAFREKLRHEKDLAPRTINKILACVTAVFDYARRHNYTERNPAEVVERVKLDTREITILADNSASAEEKRAGRVSPEEVPTPEEITKLIDAIDRELTRAFVLTAVHTGAREGELLALAWPDVDFEARTIAIRRSLSWAKTRAEREAGLTGPRFYPPKTRAGLRTVEIPDELVLALKKWKLACPPSRMKLVFPKADGSPLHRRTLHKEAFAPALERAKLRHFTIHSLRHFHASVLIMRKTPPTEIAARLGHASPAVTMAVYAHFFRTQKGEATNAVAEVLRAARRPLA